MVSSTDAAAVFAVLRTRNASLKEELKLLLELESGSNEYRTVYTVKFLAVMYVLHAFQKKSKKGIATPKQEIELIKSRLKRAQKYYAE